MLSKHVGNVTYDGIQVMPYLDRVVSGDVQKGVKQLNESNCFRLDDVNF